MKMSLFLLLLSLLFRSEYLMFLIETFYWSRRRTTFEFENLVSHFLLLNKLSHFIIIHRTVDWSEVLVEVCRKTVHFFLHLPNWLCDIESAELQRINEKAFIRRRNIWLHAKQKMPKSKFSSIKMVQSCFSSANDLHLANVLTIFFSKINFFL